MSRICLGVIASAFLVGGCTTGEKVSQLDVGMSRQQVVGTLGRPDGDQVQGSSEAMTYANRLTSGWGWDRADYNVVLTDGRVVQYGPGVVRQNSGPSMFVIMPFSK